MLGIRATSSDTNGSRVKTRCDECGRQINIGDPYVRCNGHTYCSEKCIDRAELKTLKACGEARLQKWEREVEKKNANIARLRRALAGDCASDISLAMSGGFWAWIKKILKFIFILPSVGFWIWAAIMIYHMVTPKTSNNNSGQSNPTSVNIVTENATKPTVTNIVTENASVEISTKSMDLVAEYESAAKEVVNRAIEATPVRKDKLIEAYEKDIEVFKSYPLEKQKEKLQKMKERLQAVKKTSSAKN